MKPLADRHSVPLYETRRHLKYIGELIKNVKIAMGREEGTGLSIRNHLPEKDGAPVCLPLAEMVARRRLSVKHQREALFKKVGSRYTVRVNLSLGPGLQQRLLEKLSHDWEKFDGQKVTRLDRTDGLKMIREDGSWVLMRVSGTDPVVCVYCEAPSRDQLDRLVESAKAFVLNP